jgi:hypothetical protein
MFCTCMQLPSIVLTGPGSLTLMALAGRSLRQQYWSESKRNFVPSKGTAWGPCVDVEPVGLTGLSFASHDLQAWLLASALGRKLAARA